MILIMDVMLMSTMQESSLWSISTNGILVVDIHNQAIRMVEINTKILIVDFHNTECLMHDPALRIPLLWISTIRILIMDLHKKDLIVDVHNT